MTGRLPNAGVPLDRLDQVHAGHIGQAKVDDDAIERLRLQGRQGLGPGRRGRDADVAVADRVEDVLALDLVVLDDQKRLDLSLEEAAQVGESVLQGLLVDRLLRSGEGTPLDAAAPALVARDDVDGDVAGARVVLQAVQNHPAGHVRQAQVERDGIGLRGLRQLERHLAPRGDQALEAELVGHFQQDRGERGVVFHDQEEPVARPKVVAVAADVHLRDGRRRGRSGARRRHGCRRSRMPRRVPPDSASPGEAREGRWAGG